MNVTVTVTSIVTATVTVTVAVMGKEKHDLLNSISAWPDLASFTT